MALKLGCSGEVITSMSQVVVRAVDVEGKRSFIGSEPISCRKSEVFPEPTTPTSKIAGMPFLGVGIFNGPLQDMLECKHFHFDGMGR
jgi:hypothetical protein